MNRFGVLPVLRDLMARNGDDARVCELFTGYLHEIDRLNCPRNLQD